MKEVKKKKKKEMVYKQFFLNQTNVALWIG